MEKAEVAAPVRRDYLLFGEVRGYDQLIGEYPWYTYCPRNIRPYQCLNCPNNYTKKCHLKRHVISACNGKEPRYKCPYCMYISRYASDTYKHVKRLHENRDVFAIDVLRTRSYYCKDNLAQSDGTSTDSLPKVNEWSQNISLLLGHSHHHSFMLPALNAYQQAVQEYSSRKQKNSLDVNARSACPKCHKSYRHAHHMLRHCRFECGFPPRFQCPYCGMKSKQSNNVYKHIRVKHPGSKLEIVRLPYIQE
ncbi:PREDICTED: zinc finger protein 13-like [Vollenhovia emeryi]|uniref:zinc finger protein 13-like n=1 Tax=Vollenhovia emeryi TaxID=411798 RepID=UPI0005F44365|nr:PREDICTED: zinc finger protein 13-like [Vollenhovia emeryi]